MLLTALALAFSKGNPSGHVSHHFISFSNHVYDFQHDHAQRINKTKQIKQKTPSIVAHALIASKLEAESGNLYQLRTAWSIKEILGQSAM